MSRIFLSHASRDAFEVTAIRDWLAEEGWDDVFLDFDPDRGIAAGERWERALHEAASRCEAVVFLVSDAWLASGWCRQEYALARSLNKKLFAVLIDRGLSIADLPAELVGTWQIVDLARGQEMRAFAVRPPGAESGREVAFAAEGLRRLRRGLDKAGLNPGFFAWPPAGEPGRAPYRGLKPLEAADAGIFFGRDATIVEAVDQLRGLIEGASPRLFVILGASGAGKSSFLRAGLLPRLARDDIAFLPLPPIRPERSALSGESGLLGALVSTFPHRPRGELAAAVEQGAAGIRPLLAELAAGAAATRVAGDEGARPPAIVIAIDQAEELVLGEGTEEGGKLLAILRDLAGADGPAVAVIFAIRSDAYDALERARPLEGMKQSAMPLLPMPRVSFKEVIEGPVRRFNEAGGRLALDPQLTLAILEDIERGGGSDALPLLAFTLEQLFLECGGAGTLRRADYEAFGGLTGAIRAAVSRALARADGDRRIPSDPAAREALLRRGLVPWLAGIDPDTKAPRRNVARRDDIPAEALPLIDLLVEERLLSTDSTAAGPGRDGGEASGPYGSPARRVVTVEPAHEALLRQWDLLVGWLADDFSLLVALDGVQRGARDWDANGRSEAWLAHAGERLVEAEKLGLRPDIDAKLGRVDRGYLAASRAREQALVAEAEQRRREREEEQAQRLSDAQALAAADRRTAQRTRIGLAAAIVLALAAGGFGIYAQRQRAAAQLALSTATGTSNTLVFDIARQFQNTTGMPAALVRSVLDRALALQSDLIGSGETNPALLRARASALNAASQTLVTVGDTGSATRDAEAAIEICRRLRIQDAGDVEAGRELAVALDNLGYAQLLAGNSREALATYAESLAVVRSLPADASADERSRTRLATALQRLGDAKSANGDNQGALADYEESLTIYRALFGDGRNAAMMSDIAHALDRIGSIEAVMGDRAGAIAAFQEGLSLRRRVAAARPDDAIAQRDLAWTLGKVGEFREEEADRKGALAAYEESLAIRRKLAEDKTNARAQRDLGSSLTKVADVRRQLGDMPGALAAVEESLGVARLFARDKANAEAQRNLAETLQSAGDVKAGTDDEVGARAAYEEALAIFRRLTASGDPGAKRDLALILDSLGDLKLEAGDRAGALAAFEEGLVVRRARAGDAQDIEAQRDLGIGIEKVGTVKLAQGDRAGALAMLEEGLAIFRKLAAGGSTEHTAQARRDLVLSLNGMGDAQAGGGDPGGARAAFEESLGILRALARDAKLPTTERDLAALLDRLGNVRQMLGDRPGAIAALDESLAILTRLDGPRRDARSRVELATVAQKLGNLKLAAHDYAGAAAAFEVALPPLRGLMADGDEEARTRLVIDLNSVGGMKLQVGDLAGARTAFEEAVETARPLTTSPEARRNIANLLDNVGSVGRKLGDLDAALKASTESVGLRRDLAGPGSRPQARLDLAVGLENLADVELDRREFDPALARLREAIDLRRRLMAEVRGNDHLGDGVTDDAERIGAISYHFLMARAFPKALAAADEAREIAPDRLWIQTNRAHALMFLGRIQEARVLYRAHRGEKAQPDQSWEQAVLGDFAEFRKTGLSAPLMDEIEREFSRTG